MWFSEETATGMEGKTEKQPNQTNKTSNNALPKNKKKKNQPQTKKAVHI